MMSRDHRFSGLRLPREDAGVADSHLYKRLRWAREANSHVRMSTMPSDIQVFVRFKEPSVFAGEELECAITFKNVANEQHDGSPVDTRSGRHSRRVSLVEQSATTPRGSSAGWSKENPRLATAALHSTRNSLNRGHKATVSLSIPKSFGAASGSPSMPYGEKAIMRPGPNHRRSLSIISAGSGDIGDDYESQRAAQMPEKPRPELSHRRTSTLQAFPERSLGSHKDVLPGLNVPGQSLRRGPRNPNGTSPRSSQSGSRRSSPSFIFPPVASEEVSAREAAHESQKAPAASAPTATGGAAPGRLEALSRVGRSMSALSIASSARSSGDFHSLSNHSQETLASEQASLLSERPQFPSSRIRQHYKLDMPPPKKPETAALLMGYAQVSATFTLDGSLVDQSPFETVKRKGFLGGQAGGGVVGVKTRESTGTFFGGFTLNSIGESLGGLLNGGDLSSLKEMRQLTSSRAVPLLSTPQSLLFVDLELEPGAEKSFSFKYTLPRGLPSSHRGKAIKVVYNLVIGVQGVPGEKDMQAVRQINVPFRVFSGVNWDGEIFGHDLMQPYVILRDLAQTAAIDGTPQDTAPLTSPLGATAESSADDFLTFVDTLLDKNRRRQSSSGTFDAASTMSKSTDLQHAKHAINRAILRSNQVTADGDRAPNRFEIARDAKHVAVVILNRASHRLGETVAAVVDFSDAQLPCFSIHATLESTEKVNPALALRSGSSISRVTRKIYASHSENALFAKRVVFSPFVPVSATPTLLTSGVNLNWALRFEFAMVTQTSHHDGEHAQGPSLLEEVVRDERGVIQAAAEYAECETFEVTIPLTVYGDIVTDGLDREDVAGLPI